MIEMGDYAMNYPNSAHEYKDGKIYTDIRDNKKILVVTATDDDIFDGLAENIDGKFCKICPLNHHNADALRKIFPFTAPVPVLRNKKTIGLGDRLGTATNGHIRLLKDYPDFKPVLAQQSMRELNLTGRTYENVIDDVTFAVFCENYQGGFGADGDHLKTAEDIKYALNCGYTMITLDCSEHIDNSVISLSDNEVAEKYASNPAIKLKEKYSGKTFDIDGGSFTFDEIAFKRIVLTYKKAIDFAVQTYDTLFANGKSSADFELSIDETLTPTTPLQHFFVANELCGANVNMATVAPRFCGEFQKGIDYIGDVAQFEREFRMHAKIARHFGYKISIHSGSDKFAVFSIVGRETDGIFHVKTAGTNWLEAVRVIAKEDPRLYREIHKFALSVLDEAKKYYAIGADITKIPDVDALPDGELASLMDKDDSRQVLHITYGLILNEKNPDGSYKFKDRMYRLWLEKEDAYCELLYKHIGTHLDLLGKI